MKLNPDEIMLVEARLPGGCADGETIEVVEAAADGIDLPPQEWPRFFAAAEPIDD